MGKFNIPGAAWAALIAALTSVLIAWVQTWWTAGNVPAEALILGPILITILTGIAKWAQLQWGERGLAWSGQKAKGKGRASQAGPSRLTRWLLG